MQRFSGISGAGGAICGALLLVLSGLAGCGPDPEVVAEQERQEKWQAIELAKESLEESRQALAEARAAAEAAAAAADEGEATQQDAGDDDGVEESAADGEQAAGAGDVEALQAEVDEAAQSFSQQLVEFINANAPEQGQEPPVQVAQAIRMKSNEDILVAQEYIRRGGDYRRAIEIYDTALAADPSYERLQQLKAEAEEMRYVTEERFAQVENGMTRDEVEALLGPVNLRNIRDYEEKDAVAWFYPKDSRGSAAAVWFNQERSGEYVVYQSDFNFKDADGEE